ncbi:transcriptional regulator, partial [mine drainage metagenome]
MTIADEITNAFKNFKTFTFNDVRILLSSKQKGISDKTIQVTLSRMVKNERVYKITKGVFSLERRDDIVGFAFAPFYYGGLAALMIRDLIDDQVKIEIMTTRRVKRSFVEVYGGSSVVVVHHIPKRYYFGFEDLKYGDMVVPVSNPEKTLIDLFYYKQRLSLQDYAEVLKSIK